MLRELHIKHYAIIDEVSLELSEGFNVITGETGAGKSILLGALSLILGERSSLEGVRQGSKEAVLEAAFDPIPRKTRSSLSQHQTNFDTSMLDDDDLDVLILKRIVSKTGKNRAYINGAMASLSLMKQAGQQLVEVHGQQGQHHLVSLEWQGSLLDDFGALSKLKGKYEIRFQSWSQLKQEKDRLEQNLSEGKQETSLLSFQCAEIRDAKLSQDEELALDREERTLQQWENIRSSTQMAHSQLSNERGILSLLDETATVLQNLNAMTEDASSELDLWEQAQINLKELTTLLRARLQEDVDQPERLQEVEARLFLIHQLKRKYQRTVPELLSYQAALEAEIFSLSEKEGRFKEINAELKSAEANMLDSAKTLSQARKTCGRKLQAKVKTELDRLGMEKTQFEVRLQPCVPTISGTDQIEFLIALPGETLRGLRKIASGGELSRIMLALKVVLAEVDPVPTFVFDEVDAGVGGGIAERVGRRLFALSTQHQVLCITHLPQIAALADHHYKVEKTVSDGRVLTSIQKLSDTERIEELARMLGGVHITDLTRRHAEEMVKAR